MRFVWFGDEQSITGYGGNAVDFCFSEHCLAAFREWLRTQYPSLEGLNGAWGTDFASWNDIVPDTTDERHQEASRKLLEVEAGMRKKR